MTAAEPVVVLGGGPAGLGAALALARTGRPVQLLEASPRFGGLTSSLDVGGQRVDIGSHRLHPSTSPRTLALLRSLLGPELQVRRRNGRIRLFDRWVAFPLRPRDLARSLPVSFTVRAGAGALRAMTRRDRERTFAEYVSTRLGTVMGEEFYFPYARKMWGLEPDRISGAQARRRISADSPAKLVGKVFAGRGDRTPGAGSFYYYPAGGFGRISESLADAAMSAGADLRTGATVRRLEPTGRGWAVVSDAGTFRGTVLSTMPLTVLARALGRPELVPDLRYRSMIVVYLVVAGAPYTAFDAHYLPGAFTPVTRISEPRNYRSATPAWPDPPDSTVLCAEVPCAPGDGVWELSDPDLTGLVVAALDRCRLPTPRVLDTTVLRKEHAYPVYPVGYEMELDPLFDHLAGLPRLLTFGRQGLFAHDNTHHALDMAWAAADVVRPDGTIDRVRWAAELHRFGQHVVED